MHADFRPSNDIFEYCVHKSNLTFYKYYDTGNNGKGGWKAYASDPDKIRKNEERPWRTYNYALSGYLATEQEAVDACFKYMNERLTKEGKA